MKATSDLLPVLLAVFLQLLTLSNCSCVFDRIKPKVSDLPQRLVSHEEYERRMRRSAVLSFQPLRLHVHYTGLDTELTTTEQGRLTTVVSDTVNKVREILSVVPMEGPLILARSNHACKRVWSSGPNQGKCAVLDTSYQGETCLDNFPIPEDHLEALYVWDSSNPDPIQEVRNQGAGVKNTDYILYVTSKSTPTCVDTDTDIIAYATYCQLDHNSRPNAGYVNFCPSLLRSPKYSRAKARMAALHEMFHALGFSADLFPKFQQCQVTDDVHSCQPRPSVVKYALNAQRMVSPHVVNVTSKHYGCSTHQTSNEFGPILQTDQKGEVLSHWDAAFMYGSIMAPSLGFPHLTVLDPITLSAFEDMGWYHVNYQYADPWYWGEAGGCDFGLNPSCEEPGSAYFCTGSGVGCHYGLNDKGVCETDDFLHNCRVYQPQKEDSCTANGGSDNIRGQAYGEDSRCFYSSLTINKTTNPVESSGACYKHRCNGTSELQLHVGDGDWVICPWGSTLDQVPGYDGQLVCPDHEWLCHDPEPVTSSTVPTSTPSTSTQPHLLNTDDEVVICVDVGFSMASLAKLRQRQQESLFKDMVCQAILSLTKVTRHRINNILLLEGSVIFRFDLHPALFSDDGPASAQVLVLLSEAIKNNHLTVTLPSSRNNTLIYKATYFSTMDGGPTISHSTMTPGAVTGVVLAAVVGACFIGALVFFVQRYYATHTRVIPNQRRTARQEPQRDRTRAPRETEPYSMLARLPQSSGTCVPNDRASKRRSNGQALNENTEHSLPHQPYTKAPITSSANQSLPNSHSANQSSPITQSTNQNSTIIHSSNDGSPTSLPEHQRSSHFHRLSNGSLASSDASVASNSSSHKEGRTKQRCNSAGTIVSTREVQLCSSADDLEALEIQ